MPSIGAFGGASGGAAGAPSGAPFMGNPQIGQFIQQLMGGMSNGAPATPYGPPTQPSPAPLSYMGAPLMNAGGSNPIGSAAPIAYNQRMSIPASLLGQG